MGDQPQGAGRGGARQIVSLHHLDQVAFVEETRALNGHALVGLEALQQLDDFIQHALPHFGDYQDAMLVGQPFLYHSLLSPLINVGLVDPLTLCRRAEAEYLAGRLQERYGWAKDRAEKEVREFQDAVSKDYPDYK